MKYIVIKKELYDQGVQIEADNPKEAIRLVKDPLFTHKRKLAADTWIDEITHGPPLKLRLVIDIEYEPGSIEISEAKEGLLYTARYCYDSELFTDETEGKINGISIYVEPIEN